MKRILKYIGIIVILYGLSVFLYFFINGDNYVPVETTKPETKDNSYIRIEKYKTFLQEKAEELESNDFEVNIKPYSSGLFGIEIKPKLPEDNKQYPLYNIEFYKDYSEKIVNKYIDLIKDEEYYENKFLDNLFLGGSKTVDIKIYDYFITSYHNIYTFEVFNCAVSIDGKYEMQNPKFDEEIFLNSITYEEEMERIKNIKYTTYDDKKIDYEYEAHLYDDPIEFYTDHQEDFENEDESYLHWEFYH